MINFALPLPVFLPGQLEGLAEKLGVSGKDLAALARAEKSVITNGENPPRKPDGAARGGVCDIVRMWDIPGINREDTDCLCEAEGRYLYGAEGIRWLCEKKGVACPEPLLKVDIPRHVFYMASDRAWTSICQFAAEAENRCERIARISKLDNCPAAILMLEYRQLWERLENLEANTACPRRWKDGTIMRALNDVGYSLWKGYLCEPEEFVEEPEKPEAEGSAENEVPA